MVWEIAGETSHTKVLSWIWPPSELARENAVSGAKLSYVELGKLEYARSALSIQSTF